MHLTLKNPMKILFSKNFYVFLLSITMMNSFAEKDIDVNYYVKKTAIDTTLNKNQSLFEISFKVENNLLTAGEIQYSCNALTLKKVLNEKGNLLIQVKPGNYAFKFFYNNQYYEVYTDSINIEPTYKTELVVVFQSANYPVISDKPVIYVYPEKTKDISIKLDLKGKLGFTYPIYKDGWNFKADTSGTITMDTKKYHYLFWDGVTNLNANTIKWNEGFIVSKTHLIDFFETQLTKMGLNSKEINDYITYWCPLMAANENNYVHFMFNEEYNNYADLTVTPKPDVQFRVYMLWSGVGEKNTPTLTEQIIPTFKRKGFTLVEWGGSHITKFEINEL